jgi:hypothetical protein
LFNGLALLRDDLVDLRRDFGAWVFLLGGLAGAVLFRGDILVSLQTFHPVGVRPLHPRPNPDVGAIHRIRQPLSM